MKRNKFFILAGISLLVTCAALLIKMLLPTGWQTYTDQEAGFSIKYPSGWKIEESSELYIRAEGIRIYKENKDFLPGIHIYFSPQALVAKELVARNYQLDPNTITETKTKVGENEMITISFFQNLPIYYHSIDRDNKSYIFIARGDEEETILQKMLPTLVFLE